MLNPGTSRCERPFERARARRARHHRLCRAHRPARAPQRRRLEPRDRRAGGDFRAFQSGARAGRAVRQHQGLSARHAHRLRPAQHLPAARLCVRLPGHRRPDRAGEGLSRPHEERLPADPAGDGQGRPDPGEHRPRRRRRPVQVSGADDPREGRRALYRHLLRRDHARPRHRLGQSRHLSRGRARSQHGRHLDLARQARPPHPREVFQEEASRARC